MAAHRIAVGSLRHTSPSSKVGTCLQLPYIVAEDPTDESHVAVASFVRKFMVDDHIDDLTSGGDVGDFVGLQYYTRMRVNSSKRMLAPPDPDRETSQLGWEVYPEGFALMLRRIGDAGLPVYVTENGVATRDDDQRVRYMESHLRALSTELNRGVDIRGYLHWSAFDGFEWAEGRRPTYGLIAVDRSSLARTPRPSAHAFRRLIETSEIAALRS
jgi:beta-glucosidase